MLPETFRVGRVIMEAPTTNQNPVQPLGGRVKRMYLVGFMGAGKSTVGRILARNLGWLFYDIDKVIEEEQQTSVASIFAIKGEEVFSTA